MHVIRGCALGVLVLASLAACKFPGVGRGGAPTGQVVAKVGEQEITLRQLHAELPAESSGDPAARKQAEQTALGNMVARTVLAQAARAQGLEDTPDFALQKQRLLDGLLVQSLQQKIVSQMPATTRDEAEAYVTAHPDIFAERKIFTVDQIRMGRPSNQALLKALQPLTTLEDVEALLKQNKVVYDRSQGRVDAANTDPRLIEQILKLPPNEVFVLPIGNNLSINQIKGIAVEPFTGPAAVDYAVKLLTRQRTNEAIQREFAQIARKAAPSIHFNKDYGPADLPGPGAPSAAPAAAARSAPK